MITKKKIREFTTNIFLLGAAYVATWMLGRSIFLLLAFIDIIDISEVIPLREPLVFFLLPSVTGLVIVILAAFAIKFWEDIPEDEPRSSKIKK